MDQDATGKTTPAKVKRNYNRKKTFNPAKNFKKGSKVKKGKITIVGGGIENGPDLTGLSSDSRFILYYLTGFKLLTMDQITETVEALQQFKRFSEV